MEEKLEPPVKSRQTKIIEALVVVGVLAVLIAILFPTGHPIRHNARRSSCQSNLKQIMLGFMQYTRDYDETSPQLATSKPSFGWAGALQPYLKSTQIFQCPSEQNGPQADPSQPGYTDYWFNAKMAGTNQGKFEEAARTIALGDGDSNNARYHLWKMPQRWQSDTESPLYRHLDGANFAFADGHVKWFKAVKWKNELDMEAGPTFRLGSPRKRWLPNEEPNPKARISSEPFLKPKN